VKSILIGQRIKKLLKRNDVQIVDKQKGQVTLSSPHWRGAPAMELLVQRLRQERGIRNASFSSAAGVLTLQYDEALAKDYARLENWLQQLDQLSL